MRRTRQTRGAPARLLTAVLFSAALSAVLFCGCSAAQPLTRTAVYLDTAVSVTLYDAQSEELLDDCMALIEQREALWSRTIETSDIARLNAAKGETVTVSQETAALLRTAQTYTLLTDGAFDVTTAPLTALWETAAQSGVLPTDEALSKTAQAVNAQAMTIEGCAVTLPEEQAVDLGGIAKGQIADELSALLTARGCKSALIDLGGNIYAHGSRPDGSPFRIGILDPRDGSSVITAVEVTNGSVVTSGSYERQYIIGEESYAHILNPKTGRPVQNDLLSVTILSPQSVDGDALSTACFVMGADRAQAFIAQYEDIEAVFVTADNRVITTDGVKTAAK